MLVQQIIEEKISQSLKPDFLSVVNESAMHSVPPNSETHFKVVIAASVFVGLRQVQRHQKVYGILAGELGNPVHALALHTFTPEEWSAGAKASDSPLCMGGGQS